MRKAGGMRKAARAVVALALVIGTTRGYDAAVVSCSANSAAKTNLMNACSTKFCGGTTSDTTGATFDQCKTCFAEHCAMYPASTWCQSNSAGAIHNCVAPTAAPTATPTAAPTSVVEGNFDDWTAVWQAFKDRDDTKASGSIAPNTNSIDSSGCITNGWWHKLAFYSNQPGHNQNGATDFQAARVAYETAFKRTTGNDVDHLTPTTYQCPNQFICLEKSDSATVPEIVDTAWAYFNSQHGMSGYAHGGSSGQQTHIDKRQVKPKYTKISVCMHTNTLTYDACVVSCKVYQICEVESYTVTCGTSGSGGAQTCTSWTNTSHMGPSVSSADKAKVENKLTQSIRPYCGSR